MDQATEIELNERAAEGRRFAAFRDSPEFGQVMGELIGTIKDGWFEAENDPQSLEQLNQGRLGLRLVGRRIEEKIADGLQAEESLRLERETTGDEQ